MRYSTVLKLIAFVLCAATLLGMVGSAAGIFFLTELGDKSVSEAYEDQLKNQSIGYANTIGGIYVSQELGGVHRQIINNRYGNDWENRFFDWSRVGYTLHDGEGKVLAEQDIPSGQDVWRSFEALPVFGEYMQVISVTPREKYYPQTTEPGNGEETQIMVMPSQPSTPIGSIFVDYTDGHHEEWNPGNGEQVGSLRYDGGDTVIFESNVGELPMGDGWYPNHILFADMGGNIVYEAFDHTLVIRGSSQENGSISWHLPAGTVTTAAPVGITFTDGDFTSYDAIPEQGITVASMKVNYGTEVDGDIGGEGVASPDLIGTVFHDYLGNARFQSSYPMRLDIPENVIITYISFMDAQDNLIYEARCPEGVGQLAYDENRYLIFRGQMPGTQVPEETAPEETVPEGTEVPEQVGEYAAVLQKDVKLYIIPSLNGIELAERKAGQEVTVLQQEVFNGQLWALTREGWILIEDGVLATEEPQEPEQDVAVAAQMIPEEPEALPEESVSGETQPEETVEKTTESAEVRSAEPVPEVTIVSDKEPEVTEVPQSAAEMEAPVYPASEIQTHVYYDYDQQQEMVAEYVMQTIPEGYTMELRLARGALGSELGWTLLRLAEAFRSILLKALGVCIAVFVLCVVHLCCSAGRTRRTNEVKAGGLNRIPLDLYLGVDAVLGMGLVALAVVGSQYFARNDEQLALILLAACSYLLCLLIVGFFFAFVAQIKTPGGFWWRNSICGRCLGLVGLIWKWLKSFSGRCWTEGKPMSIRLFWKLRNLSVALWLFGKRSVLWLWDTGKRLARWLWGLAVSAWNWSVKKLVRFFGLLPITWQFLLTGFVLVFLLYICLRSYKVGWILVGFGLFFATILYAASAFAILLESAKRMSKGDLDTKVDDRMLIGGFRDFAGELNDLADVAVVAAQKQLKSERMKTELITNVSHDIKTPLTSIINYVDLLQKPHTEQEQEAYLEVLSRQSLRLKKLIDDLMEMSKASTGNLSVEITRMDAGETINQALGEFADKLDRAELTPVFRQPEDKVEMMADGRLVWRVMSNLLGNAVKYALPGTRVYVDLLQMDGKVIISMKNISREELNVHADELLERFVRGDASRNTEGSGLGLNIAKSLMELQRGQLQILVDGDLFKVTLIFPGV